MASTVKKSMKAGKKEGKKMPNDDFYKEAQMQHIKDIASGIVPGESIKRNPAPPEQQVETRDAEEEVEQASVKITIPTPKVQTLSAQASDNNDHIDVEPPPIVIQPEPAIASPERTIDQSPQANQQKQPGLQQSIQKESINMSNDFDDFDFVSDYDDTFESGGGTLLPENTAVSSVSVGFVGVGGGGGKIAKAFIDEGFNRTLVVNTTVKDRPSGLDDDNFLLLPGADGVGKNITLGKRVLKDNGALVEDSLRTRIGRVDWLFVLAGGGGGTGSACHALDESFNRYLKSVQAIGKVVYIITSPSAQELLNPTIKTNYESALSDVQVYPHIVIDNERQLQLLRGKVGMLGMFPAANRTFAKLLSQVLKLSSESSPIQTFDSKDLERCLQSDGRIFLGTTVMRDPKDPDLGSLIYQNCLQRSPCPTPRGKIKSGVLLLVVTSEMASDPGLSNHLEAAISYVGGRSDTLFSGVYVRERLPGLVAITMLSGIN
jgi:cell division GTPase FtsZ